MALYIVVECDYFVYFNWMKIFFLNAELHPLTLILVLEVAVDCRQNQYILLCHYLGSSSALCIRTRLHHQKHLTENI